jgi:hypothetical protein
MDGTKKCTYIILAAAGIGAPAFVVKGVSTPTAFTFDLHFAEWKNSDIATMPVSGASGTLITYYFGNYAADTYPNPLLIYSDWNSG